MANADALRPDLVELCLRLGDDRLVLGHRLSEWTGFAPVLEEELSLGNVALDLLGQAEDLLGRAGELRGDRSADDLAFFRDAVSFRNLLLVEQDNGDFAHSVVRQLFFDVWDLHAATSLESSTDDWLARFGARAAREAAYHARHSREWVIRLGDGTEESHRRVQEAVARLWRFTGEFFERDAVIERLVEARVCVDPRALRAPWTDEISNVLREATIEMPAAQTHPASGGRRGAHGEGLGRMLSEMQGLARAFPGAAW